MSIAAIGAAAGRGIGKIALAFSERANPITGGPAAPLKTSAFMDSFGPSLMPRSSMHQGMAAGLSLLAAEAVGLGIDRLAKRVAPEGSPTSWKIASRAGLATVGFAVSRMPEQDDEHTLVASARSAGDLAMWGALGGIVYEGGVALRQRYPAKGPIRPIVIGLAGFGLALYHSRQLLQARQQLIDRWTEDDKPASVPAALGIGLVVANVGRGLGRGFLASRQGTVEFFGTDPARAFFGRSVNLIIWGAGAVAAYTAGVSYIARANEKIETAYSSPPTNEYVSGGPNSISPFEELGLQGRRYVTDVMPPDLIEKVMGEPAVAHPIRAYIGFNSEPIYSSGRAEMALDELERLGGFDRKYLLLVSPTGTGWVDQTMIESAEFFTRGDIATVCIQYGRSPSFLALQKVQLGAAQFRQLLWGVKQRLADRAKPNPTVLVFGESLGAWSSSDVVMHQGIAGFDHYGIDRALWFGLPGLAKWSKTGMREGSSDLVPPGTVGAFDHPGQLFELSEEERDKLRAVVLDHDNDPIAQVSPRMAVKKPEWLVPETKGRGVPDSMSWSPIITFVQVGIDAMNAMVTVPGQFKSFGHDYRLDTARMVHMAYHLPDVSREQLDSVEEALRQLELERGERIKQGKEEEATQGPQRTQGAKWLRDRGPEDEGRPEVSVTPGEAKGDVQ